VKRSCFGVGDGARKRRVQSVSRTQSSQVSGRLPAKALPEANMREANVLDNIKRCSVVLTCLTGVGVRMDAQQPVVE
jgi:hypothetical protein